jgi:PKHD-type hydroxylase
MLVHIPGVLSQDQVNHCRSVLQTAAWGDGRMTAGYQSAKVKDNRQLPEDLPEAKALGDIILKALQNNSLFISAALPLKVYPPLFNRYEAGMGFGNHVDNGVRYLPGGNRVRTDISATLFLSQPDEYDGGELQMDDTYGAHKAKLPAGDMVLYPATSLHRMVRTDAQRALLFDLDAAIGQVSKSMPDHPATVSLVACYHNLLRLWAET